MMIERRSDHEMKKKTCINRYKVWEEKKNEKKYERVIYRRESFSEGRESDDIQMNTVHRGKQ